MRSDMRAAIVSARANMVCDNATHYGYQSKQHRATNSGMWRNALPPTFAALASSGLHIDPAIRDGDVYEFGVFRGGSMRLLHSMTAFNKSKLWGLDSFAGLPGLKGINLQLWATGKYSADPRTDLLRELGGETRLGFVKGFYNESLKDGEKLSQRLGMRPAKYVDIDADLYVSSIDALRFLFLAKLIRPGTVIGFDDYSSFICGHKTSTTVTSPLTEGEGRAHAEAAREFGARFVCIAGSCLPPSVGLRCQANNPIFVVESVGDARGGDTGFHLTPAQLATWKSSDPACMSGRSSGNPAFNVRTKLVRDAHLRRKSAPLDMAG